MQRLLQAAVLLIIAIPVLAPTSSAQLGPLSPAYVDFQLSTPNTFGFVVLAGAARAPDGTTISNQLVFNYQLLDLSTDADASGTQGSALFSDYTFDVKWDGGEAPAGWNYIHVSPLPFNSKRGDVRAGLLFLQVLPTAVVKEAFVNLTITQTGQSPREHLQAQKSVLFGARVYPQPAIQISIDYPLNARPNELVRVPVQITNADLYYQKVQVGLTIQAAEDEGIDPGVLPVMGGGAFYLEPQEVRHLNLTFLTPKAKFWYWGVPLQYTVFATNSANPTIGQSATGVLIVDGFYLSRQLLIIIPLLLFLALLLLWVVVAGKRYYDQRVLGKPIPPWKIPVEARALEELRRSDPKKFYVTRYFLMEEEYSSALLWFHSFKRRNKQQIKNEAASARYAERAAALQNPSLARFDRRAERLKRRFQHKQERRRLQLEAKLERLQGKLDLHFEEDFDRDHLKWEAKVEKLKKKANRPWYREHKKWEKTVAKILAAWEKPFKKDQKRHEAKVAKILAKHEVRVKKKDKVAWKDWKVAVDNTKKENELRKAEGREALPIPELRSKEVEYPDLPAPFKTPPRPKLPPEPEAPHVKGLPPEPKLVKPKLDDSHYARKARRARRKTERKVRRYEKKLNRLLARNERDRVRALAKAERKRRKLTRKSKTVFEPTLTQRVFRLTPEDRERRAHKKLLVSLAKEKVRAVEDNERARLEVLEVEARRREAELVAKLIRGQAEVRRGSPGASARIDSAAAIEKDEALLELRAAHDERLAKEREKAQGRIESERAQAQKELHAQLAEELIKERLGPEPAAGPAKAAPAPKPAAKARRK